MNNDLWNYQVNNIQKSINNTNSALQGKVLTKLDFWIENKKHVWYRTIQRLPSPLDPSRTVDEDFTISKYKNHVTLYPIKHTRIKDGKINDK